MQNLKKRECNYIKIYIIVYISIISIEFHDINSFGKVMKEEQEEEKECNWR